MNAGEIVVRAFDNEKVYFRLNPLTSDYEVGDCAPCKTNEFMRGYCGWGRQYFKFPTRTEKLLAAVYCIEQNVKLQVGRNVFDLYAADVRTTGVLPFVRKVDVCEGEQKLLSFLYWIVSTDEWPDDGDLFRYIQSELRTEDQINEFLTYVNRSAVGVSQDLGVQQ